VRIEQSLGDALQIAGAESWRAVPGRLELYDVEVNGLSDGFGVRARDGAQVLLNGHSRVKVAVEGPASLVTELDGALWPDTVVIGPAPAAEDESDEGSRSWPAETESNAAGDDSVDEESDVDLGDGDEDMLDDETSDESTDSAPETAPERSRAERVAAYRSLARALNQRLAAATQPGSETDALRGYLEGLFALGTEYGWFPLGGDEWLRAELAAFGARHGRAGFEAAVVAWPLPANGKSGLAGYRELYSRGYGRDFDCVFLDEDLAALMGALRALQAAPNETREHQLVVDEYVAVQTRFHFGHAASRGAGRRIDVALRGLDPSVTWALLRTAAAHSHPGAHLLSSALSAETRRALLRHWSAL